MATASGHVTVVIDADTHQAERKIERLARKAARLQPCPGWVDALGYIAVTAIVLTYLLGTATQFDWANAVLWPPVIAPAVLRRAWPSALITFAFGVFGTLHVLGVSV